MRRVAALALVLLFAASAAPYAAPQASTSTADVEDAPWWPDPALPVSQFREGWNLRIPLEVHAEHPMREGAAVQVHLDLARSLMEGGWPGRDDIPASFRAYPEAVRLVEYDDWDTIRGQVPFRLYTTWLEADQSHSQYEKQQTGPFHGQRNAVTTLEWRLPRDLAADDTHRYFVYFDIEQNAGAAQEHRKPSQQPQPDETERLDGLYWVGAGTSFYGYYPHQTTEDTMTVFAAGGGLTNVKVYAGERSTEDLDDRRSDKDREDGTEIRGPNPEFCLLCPANPGGTKSYSFGFNPTHFRVEADQPVVVLTHRLTAVSPGADTTPVPEFVPSREGTTLGWTFDVPQVTGSVYVIKPPGPKAQISVAGAPQTNTCESGQIGHPVQLTFCRVNLNIDAGNQDVATTRTITATGGPVLVQFVPAAGTAHPAQAASATGSPVGSLFYASTLAENCSGWTSPAGGFQVTAWDRDAYIDIVDDTTNPATEIRDAVQITADPPAPQRVPGNGLQIQRCTPPPPGPAPTWNTPLPYVTQTVAHPETSSATGPIQVRAGQFGGGPIAQTTPFGGRHGTDFHVEGPFVVYNFYATTALEVTRYGDEAVTESQSLGTRGTPLQYDVDADAVTSITADKPVTVFPLGTPTNYARFHAAKPDFLTPDILPGQYRGYLFDVTPQDGLDPVFLTGLPGQTLDSQFQVRNLARWDDQPLGDTVRFSATVESRNWEGAAAVGVTFDEREMTLADASVRNNRITMDLPSDIPSDTQLTVRVTAVSQGNPQLTQAFSVVVLVRQTFDVDLWFGAPTSVSGPREKPLRIQEGAQEPVPFVIRNEGSGVDDFQLTFGAPGGGWDVRITDTAGRPLSRVEGLAPQTQVGATLHVRAPLTQELTAVTIPIDAVSETSPLASDRIILSARLALSQELRLEAETLSKTIEPGGTQRFDVILANTGEDGLSVDMSTEAALPPGWTLAFAGLGDPEDPPISLQPGQQVTIPLDLSAPTEATADDFVSFLLAAEGRGEGVEARDAVSLSATVGASHDLEVPPIDGLDLLPGEPAEVEVTVKNNGNGETQVHIAPANVPGGWIVAATNQTLIERGESATFTIQIEAPQDAPPGPVELLLTAQSQGPASAFVVPATVRAVHEIAWRTPDPVTSQPGDTHEVPLILENRGNVAERVRLQATGPWALTVEPDQVDVAAGGLRTVHVGWAVGDDLTGDQEIVVTANAESGPSETATIAVRVVDPRLDAHEIVQTTVPRGPGSIGNVLAVIRNPGDVPVLNAEVRLIAGGQDVVLDRVGFLSVGPNGTVVAPLRWTEDPEAEPERVEWGHWRADEFRVLGSAAVPAGAPSDIDGEDSPLPVLILVAAFAAAAVLRRRGGRP